MKYELKFSSRYKPDTEITVGQWLGEVMCERLALSKNKELPRAFWLKSKSENREYSYWYKHLKLQTIKAYQLIKKFGEEKVLYTVKNNKKIFSLSPKWVSILVEECKVPNKEREHTIYASVDTTNVREQKKKENILSLLMEL